MTFPLPQVAAQMRERRRLLQWTLAVMAGGLAPRADAEGTPTRRPWPARRATPRVDLPGLRLADLKGQVVLLNFWASWCEPCRAEMPSLETIAAQLTAEGLAVIAVNFKESEATIRRFTQSTSLALPVARDADGAVAKAFGVNIFPTTVAIARNGRAAFSVIGAVDWASAPAQPWISELLRQRA
jgi:thiol-disulfide isomerase/thioredoxin